MKQLLALRNTLRSTGRNWRCSVNVLWKSNLKGTNKGGHCRLYAGGAFAGRIPVFGQATLIYDR